MNIALDYDDTYTRDSFFWDEFITLCKKHNVNVFILTKRGTSNQGETAKVEGVKTHYSNRRAKYHYARENGIPVDIWIDDSPMNLFTDG